MREGGASEGEGGQVRGGGASEGGGAYFTSKKEKILVIYVAGFSHLFLQNTCSIEFLKASSWPHLSYHVLISKRQKSGRNICVLAFIFAKITNGKKMGI